jgi:hypothetical protein
MNGRESGPCANMMCANNNRNEISGCRMYSHHAADVLCENYVSPDYAGMMDKVVCKLRSENKMLRNMNKNLVMIGKQLAKDLKREGK